MPHGTRGPTLVGFLHSADHAAELSYYFHERGGLGSEFFGCSRTFFGIGGRLLGYLFHLRESLGYLLNTTGLFLTPETDFIDKRLYLRGFLSDGADRDRNLIDFCLTVVRFGDGFLDQSGSVFGGLGASLREVADFICDYGEAPFRLLRRAPLRRRH